MLSRRGAPAPARPRPARPPSCFDPNPARPPRRRASPRPRRCGRGAVPPRFDLVAYAGAAPGEQLLQRRLEVDPRLRGELDPGLERLRDRGRGALEAEGEKAGADQRLGRPRQRALALEQRLGRDPGDSASGLRLAQHLRDPEAAPDLRAGDAADRLVVDLGQAARVDGREAREDLRRDGEPEHAVAEEGEPLVGVGALARSRRSGSAPGGAGPPAGRRSAPPSVADRRVDVGAQPPASGRRVLDDEVDRVADRLDLAPPAPRRPRSRSGPRAPSPARRGRASRRRGPP